MLNVVCVNAGNYLGRGAEYVAKLFDGVRRNLPNGYEGRFICFTNDDPANYETGIEVRPLPVEGLKGWFNKLALFKAGVFDDGDQNLYFDLDTLITGRLDEIVKYDGEFAILRDAYRPDGWQSAVMAWRAGFGAHLWNEFVAAGYPNVDGGDQAWIEDHQDTADILQEKFPDLFVSYKVNAGKIPKTASVVFFHGLPRIHEITTGWVPEVWKIGGLTRADLDTICNTETVHLFDNVRSSIELDLPWLDYAEAHDGHVVLCGGGPSIKGKVDEILWRQSLGQEVWALNNSAAWLIENGITPDAQVIVDARPENLKFVRRGLKRYLIASQCDPSIFRALRNENVLLWHSNAPGIEKVLLADKTDRPLRLIGGGSTVGLSAMTLASVLGKRNIHLYGYDSSVAESEHHAYPQANNDTDIIIDVLVEDGARYKAAPWMVQQANEFCDLAAQLAERGAVITVAGEGLLPHLARDMMRNPVMNHADYRAAALLSRLPEGPIKGAEIGVFGADLSIRLLARPDLELIMIDPWAGSGASYKHDQEDWHAHLTQAEQDRYYVQASNAVVFAGTRATIIRKESLEAASDIPDASLDFVFIDADHSYEAVRDDIAAWFPKVKPGGLLCGHDYANREAFPHFNVDQAVDEFVEASGLTLDLGDNCTWYVRLPAPRMDAKAA